MQDLAQRLGNVRHFQHLPAADLQRIVAAGQVTRHAAGSLIFLQDEPAAGMFVLLDGLVHLCGIGPEGQEQIMAVIEPVIMFNEVTVLDGGPNPLTAVAIRDCLTWQISHDSFQALMQRYPHMGLSLLPVLAARNRRLLAQYEDLSFRSVPARTAKLLLDLSRYGQQPIDRRQHPISWMAARIATVPEAISRSLSTCSKSGLINSSRSTIIVTDPEGLARFAQVGPRLPGD